MGKGRLSLTVESDLVALAKNSGINLSAEFEEWIKIRLGKTMEKTEETVDYDLEKAKLLQDLALLESQQELKIRHKQKEKEEQMVINSYIENIKEFPPSTQEEKEKRADGLVFIMKKRLRKDITRDEALKIIEDSLNEN